MKIWTYDEARTKIERDMDTVDEEFYTDDELREAFNDAIRIAESHIHELGVEDEYFLARCEFDLIQDEDTYPLPRNMFTNKIRGLIYNESVTLHFPITKYKRLRKFESILEDELHNQNTNPHYKYYLLNNSVEEETNITIVPPGRKTVKDGIILWFIREANELTEDSSRIDIPFIDYIFQFVKNFIRKKENMLDELDILALEKQEQLMITTLTRQIPDDDDTIEQDLDHYEEHS